MGERSLFSSSFVDTHVGGWEALYASVDDLIRRRPHAASVGPLLNAAPSVRECAERGVCVVPIYRVTIGAPNFALFDRWLPQQEAGVPFAPFDWAAQPIALYQVGETYYVRDGHREVAQARARSQLFLRAHVVDVRLDTVVQPDDALPLLLAHERAEFFARHGFSNAHPLTTATVTVLGSLPRLSAHLDLWRGLQHRSTGERMLQCWSDELFVPMLRLMRRRNVLRSFPNCGEIDLFLWALDRQGPLTDDQPVRDRLRLARRNIIALWLTLRSQQHLQ